MDSSLLTPTDMGIRSNAIGAASRKAEVDSLILKNLNSTQQQEDQVDVGFNDIYKNLSLTARDVIQKLNELLEADLPDGIQSLDPASVTPDKTASMIVDQATAFFGVYADRHPDLEDEELLNGFMDTIRSGINSGYDQAFETLKGLGAFEFEGVQSGIEETKTLIEEKLESFERKMRKQLGLDSEKDLEEQSIDAPTYSTVLAQGGAQVLSVTA